MDQSNLSPKSNLPPVYFSQTYFGFESLEKDHVLDISGAQFADCISFEAIIHAEELSKKLRIIRSTLLMERLRKYTKDTELGVCILYIYNDIILVIIDSYREFIQKDML